MALALALSSPARGQGSAAGAGPGTPWMGDGIPPRRDDNLKIWILLGQSNMAGHGYAYDNVNTMAWNIPTVEFLLSPGLAPDRYRAQMPYGFKDDLVATWLTPRSDAWCVHYSALDGTPRDVRPTEDEGLILTGVAPLSPGFGAGTIAGTMFGPELAMGTRLAAAVPDPLFLFKSTEGGTSLAVDWRPPTAVASRGGTPGVLFANSMARFSEFLDALDADLADDGFLDVYGQARGYEVCGAVWLQGWNERFADGPYTVAEMQAEYADNLRDLVYSIRASDPRIPFDLPLIIGESADQEPALNAARMEAVAALNAEIPGSAAFFFTDDMIYVNWGNGPGGVPFMQGQRKHFHLRAENYLEIGWKAAGLALDNDYLHDPLRAFWRFDGDAVRMPDSSQQRQHGTLVGDAEVVDGSLVLDGHGDYGEVPYSAALNPARFTASLLARVEGGGGSHRTVLTSSDASQARGFSICATSSDKWSLEIGHGAGRVALEADDVIVAGRWYDLTATYDGATATLFVDGLPRVSEDVALAPNMDAPLRVGSAGPQSGFLGRVDDVRIRDRVLSASRILDQHIATFEVLGHWRFEGDVDQATDDSGHDRHGSLEGDAFISQGELVLDGDGDYVAIPSMSGTTGALTIAARIYRDGQQSTNNVGLVVSRPPGAEPYGLSLVANRLRYSWHGDADLFQSGLFVPAHTWTFVALVIEPTRATIYMDDGSGMRSSVRYAPHPAKRLDREFRLGDDQQFPGRFFKGRMADVFMQSRALSAAEVLELASQP